MSVIPVIFSIFLLFSIFFYNNQLNDEIVWSEQKKLVWEDFMGRPEHLTGSAANVTSGISYSPTIKNDTLTVITECYFDIKKILG